MTDPRDNTGPAFPKYDTDDLFTEGAYRIVEAYDNKGWRCVYIQHNCPELSFMDWVGCIYNASWRDKPCNLCYEVPPEGLQMAFWFLKEGGSMTKDGCEVKLEMGAWMLSKIAGPNKHFIYHRCRKEETTYFPVLYMNTKLHEHYGEGEPRWACGGCLKTPPEELEALYLMLESEYAYSVMQTCILTANIGLK